MKMKAYYLVGNAHLDPVWQWRWQEGSAEAKATVRSALDRMKEFPDFRFVCSSASIYRWIEEFDEEMFEEIKQRIREGRFVIVGGWHVQPDCNLPSGEGFARQSLYAQRYFKETFGTTAKVGYNVDSFGHHAMLPQILKKSGMNAYIFMRPGPHEKELEANLFDWVSPDGSSVTTFRIMDPYCFKFDNTEALAERMRFLDGTANEGQDAMPLFYGVGNHGGGPTIRHLEVMNEYAAAHPELEMIYSDLSDFFDRVADVPRPALHDDLQHHAPGCYATVSRIKNGIRRAESALGAAENYTMLARTLLSKSYPTDRFAAAWREVCFCHFHDSMDGCSIKEVYDDADLMLGAARNTAAVAENNALQSISWATDTSADRDKGLPVFVFNPHGFDVDSVVSVNQQHAGVRDAQGNEVPSQIITSGAAPCSGRGNTAFRARIPALGYAVYYLHDEPTERGESVVRATPMEGAHAAGRQAGPVLENEYWRIQFEDYSGYILSMIDKRTGENVLDGRGGAVPIVVDEYYHDTWSHGNTFFTNHMARFSDAAISVVENGDVLSTVKVVSRYNDSTLTLYFTLCAGDSTLHIRGLCDWSEKHKMLKLAFPMKVAQPIADYEIPYGVMRRPADGEEEPGLSWVAVRNETSGDGYAFLNDSSYSTSIRDGCVYLTVLRSPIYADHGGSRDGERAYTEQGIREFTYAMMPCSGENAPIIRAARLLNTPPVNIIENWHTGKWTDKIFSGLTISADNVMLSALKRAEDGCGTVIRLYETEGKQATFRATGATLPVPLTDTIGAYSVETYYLPDGEKAWKKVLLTECEA